MPPRRCRPTPGAPSAAGVGDARRTHAGFRRQILLPIVCHKHSALRRLLLPLRHPLVDLGDRQPHPVRLADTCHVRVAAPDEAGDPALARRPRSRSASGWSPARDQAATWPGPGATWTRAIERMHRAGAATDKGLPMRNQSVSLFRSCRRGRLSGNNVADGHPASDEAAGRRGRAQQLAGELVQAHVADAHLADSDDRGGRHARQPQQRPVDREDAVEADDVFRAAARLDTWRRQDRRLGDAPVRISRLRSGSLRSTTPRT